VVGDQSGWAFAALEGESVISGAQEWAEIIEAGKPSYRGLTEPDSKEEPTAEVDGSEWGGVRDAHGGSRYHETSVFRRVQRRVDP
jgi:hypothetical protein